MLYKTKNKFVSHYLCVLSVSKIKNDSAIVTIAVRNVIGNRDLIVIHKNREQTTYDTCSVVDFLAGRPARFPEPHALDLMQTNLEVLTFPARCAEIFANFGNDP